MDISKFLQGSFLRAQDLDEGDVVTLISETGSKLFEDEERILLVTDFGTVVMNKTNLKKVAAAYGPDTRKWHGKSVRLCKEQTNYGGKMVDCIRVYPDIPKEVRPIRDTRVEKRPAKELDNIDIPF